MISGLPRLVCVSRIWSCLVEKFDIHSATRENKTNTITFQSLLLKTRRYNISLEPFCPFDRSKPVACYILWLLRTSRPRRQPKLPITRTRPSRIDAGVTRTPAPRTRVRSLTSLPRDTLLSLPLPLFILPPLLLPSHPILLLLLSLLLLLVLPLLLHICVLLIPLFFDLFQVFSNSLIDLVVVVALIVSFGFFLKELVVVEVVYCCSDEGNEGFGAVAGTFVFAFIMGWHSGLCGNMIPYLWTLRWVREDLVFLLGKRWSLLCLYSWFADFEPRRRVCEAQLGANDAQQTKIRCLEQLLLHST